MKNTKECPKCHSHDIVRCDGKVLSHGAGNYIKLGRTMLSTVNVHRYICCTCGFTEEWIDEEDLEKVINSQIVKR